MAEKRMFSNKITESDAFLDMPHSAQSLYFHLNMYADDDGVIDNAKRIKSIVNANDDDFRILFEKGYLIALEKHLILVKHWWINNWIKADHYTRSSYDEELALVGIESNRAYTLDEEKTVTRNIFELKKNGSRSVAKELPDGSLEEKRIEENRREENKKGKKKKAECLSREELENLIRLRFPQQDVVDEMIDWVAYKEDRNEGYTEKGFNALMKQVENKINEHGANCVCYDINNSIARGWQGITWSDNHYQTKKTSKGMTAEELKEWLDD